MDVLQTKKLDQFEVDYDDGTVTIAHIEPLYGYGYTCYNNNK